VYYLLAIAAVGFLIVVHEGGHYFVARWCQMRIERFSIGFGPGILKKRSKKTGTIFQLAPIPFGGFVEIRGMNIAEEVDPDDLHAYPNRPTWQRFVTIFAGPATNYLSALLLAFCLYTCHGERGQDRWYGVDHVLADYNAVGKLESGDRILRVDGAPLSAAEGKSLTERVNEKHGAALALTVLREGKELEVSIVPKPAKGSDGQALKNPDGSPMFILGIKPTVQWNTVDVGIATAAADAVAYPIKQTREIMRGLYGIVFGSDQADPGGPKRMIDEFSKAFKAGFVPGIELLMMLSVYLGLFNLFPLPALDGGRLVFLGYELVTRRRANPKIEAMVHMGGIMVLGVVMILVTLHDFHVL
jgi:regulator of sigma E protease